MSQKAESGILREESEKELRLTLPSDSRAWVGMLLGAMLTAWAIWRLGAVAGGFFVLGMGLLEVVMIYGILVAFLDRTTVIVGEELLRIRTGPIPTIGGNQEIELKTVESLAVVRHSAHKGPDFYTIDLSTTYSDETSQLLSLPDQETANIVTAAINERRLARKGGSPKPGPSSQVPSQAVEPGEPWSEG